VIAFYSGGFYDEPRLVAGIGACVLAAAAALAAERPLPRSWPGRMALTGLAGLTIWTALSLSWAPLGAPALQDVQRLVLYMAALAGAAAWLRPGAAAAVAEPLLALGALVVIGYGLAGKLLPGLLHFHASREAAGRLEQPITYWNATGALAAIGLVLCARLAGSPERPGWMRALAAGACPALATGLYLTLSRGAFAAVVIAVLVLLSLAPDRAQLRALGLALAGAGAAVALAVLLPALLAVQPAAGGQRQGAAMLAALVLLGAAGALVQLALARRESAGRMRVDALGGRRLRLAPVAVALVVVVAGIGYGASSHDDRRGADARGAARLRSLQSNRYGYWQVALRSFADESLRGIGTAGFRVVWLRERKVRETVKDAHSLYVETAAELGLVGLLLLGALFAGTAVSARRAYRLAPAAAAGPAAALAAFAFHAALDWDWELPAVTLVALALAGLLVAAGDRATPRARG
jgi:hypothetical protein